MLAAVNFNSGTGALVVVGNAIADTISLTGSADYQSFTVDINNNASLQQTFNYSDVTSVRVVAGDGDDFVYNTLLIDTEIFGQDGNDHLEGGWANDLVMGGNGIDVLVGRNGDDILNGQDGNDWLFGGPGVDALSGITGNDNLYGGVGDDTLNGHGGNDSLWGGAGDDSLLGGAGDDLLRGQDGDDTLRGEGGDDWLVGANGDDELYGDAGVDELLGQAGNDILNGGADNDFLWGSTGEDTLRGDAGNDRLYGGADNDLLLGNEGRDIIRGDGGDDTLRGGDGNDDLYGLGGTDTLFGDAGDDLLDAGGDVAADVLTGGIGLDRFVVLGNIGSTSVDVITDLEANETINGDAGGNTPTPSGTASIGDLVFEDSNDNQQFDAGEVGISDVTLTLFSGTTEIATQTTDASGLYKFENLPAGNYRVELTTDLTHDYDLTTPTSVDVTLADAEVNNSVDFGAQALPPGTASIGDLVFEDTNQNGFFDVGEQGVADIVVELFRNGQLIDSVTTDQNGAYSFETLRSGTFQVVLSDNLPDIRFSTGDTEIEVVLSDGQNFEDADFAISDGISEDEFFQSTRAIEQFPTIIVGPPVASFPTALASFNFAFTSNQLPLSRARIRAAQGATGLPLLRANPSDAVPTIVNPLAENCHNAAWRDGQPDLIGDPNMPNPAGSPLWDNSPLNEMADATLLGPDDAAQIGDIVVYFTDKNGDGFIDGAIEIGHSATVTQVNALGEVSAVSSKFGGNGVLIHHPLDPMLSAPEAVGGLEYGRDAFIFRK